MIIVIGASGIFVTALAIHVIRTSKWKSKNESDIVILKKQNSVKINENYDDHDITLSKTLSNFDTKNIDKIKYPTKEEYEKNINKYKNLNKHDKEKKVIFVRKIDDGQLEMFTNNDGNIETIGTIIHDGNKSIVTINDDSILQNAEIVVVNGTRFKKVPRPKERITEPLLKTTDGEVMSPKEMMNSSHLFSKLESDIVSQEDQESLLKKVKKIEKKDQTRK